MKHNLLLVIKLFELVSRHGMYPLGVAGLPVLVDVVAKVHVG